MNNNSPLRAGGITAFAASSTYRVCRLMSGVNTSAGKEVSEAEETILSRRQTKPVGGQNHGGGESYLPKIYKSQCRCCRYCEDWSEVRVGNTSATKKVNLTEEAKRNVQTTVKHTTQPARCPIARGVGANANLDKIVLSGCNLQCQDYRYRYKS